MSEKELPDFMKEDGDKEVSAVPLKTISELATQQEKAAERVEVLEQELKEAKAELRSISEDKLPSAMAEVGMKSFTLEDGSQVIIKEDVAPYVKKENLARWHAWLRDNGFGSLIKDEFTVKFGVGEEERATRLREILKGDFTGKFKEKEAVHPGTLKAFVKEQFAEGNELPEDIIKVHPYSKATIKK